MTVFLGTCQERILQIWQQLIHAAAVLSLRYEAQGKFGEEERCAGATVVVTSS